MIRVQGFWQNLPWGLNLAANVDFSNGQPYNRQLRPPGDNFNQLRPRVIMDRNFQKPWFQVIDLTVGKRFYVSKSVELQLNGTIFNILNTNNVLLFDTQVLSNSDTSDVFTETNWAKPRRLTIQVGAQF